MSQDDIPVRNSPLAILCIEGLQGPRWGLWMHYVGLIFLYLFGGSIILLYAAVLVGVLLGQISLGSLLPSRGGWTGHLLVLLTAVGSIVGARFAQKLRRAWGRMSLKVDASTIRVMDKRGRLRVIELADIRQVKARKSFWLGKRVSLVLESGSLDLPWQVLSSLDALVERTRAGAALDDHCRDGSWDVYFRSDAEA